MKPHAAWPMLMALLGGVVGGALVQSVADGPWAGAEPAAGSVVTAGEFRLVGQDGVTRGQLFLWDGRRPMLVLGDAHCRMRVTLGLSEQDGHPSMVLYDEDCRRRAALDLIPDGQPELTFRDEGDIPRARLHLLKDGSPVLRLFDPNGRTLWTAAR
ncbi:hypothetical protein [Nitrospira moscoviensis]|uniref:Uncharacterized protein n=1 Tax=Nitrospira moscoviensis TaxID=42253 RepID=A0A0K2GDV6_NITMO|nr:hypothetical protein [Nitrospira moscoviensis]ALA59136.1 exported protein of unknown function [Nitrospira moscoviensis]